MRMFFMGNALVTGIVKRIGDELQKIDATSSAYIISVKAFKQYYKVIF